MRVELESIHLNHDGTSNTTGAFSIRRNEKCHIVRPEWRRGVSIRPEDAPAAYVYERVKDIDITIRAEFSVDDPGEQTVFVRARDGYVNPKKHPRAKEAPDELSALAKRRVTTNVLGSVAKTEVHFVDGKGSATFFLDDVSIRSVGVSVSDVIWRWQYSHDGDDWEDLATSLHRIYTVIDIPSRPWAPESRDITNTQLPWTEVLDFACRAAASTNHVDEAAEKVTLWANSLGNEFVQYDNPGGGWSGFTFEDPPRFDCSELLLLLNGGKNLQGPAVNCDDCAAIVTSFSNALGCRLSEGSMGGQFSFKLHPNKKIGREVVSNGRFSRHTVAWLGACSADDALFDACLRLDLDRDETTEIFSVPLNTVFSAYQSELTHEPENCHPRAACLPVRKVGIDARHSPADNFAGREVFCALLREAGDAENLELIDFRFVHVTTAEYLLQSFWQSGNDTDVAFGIDMYEVASEEKSALLLTNTLDRFHFRPNRMASPPPGTEAFASEGNFTIVFVRDRFQFLLRNTGRNAVSCERLATLINDLLNGLNLQKEDQNGEARF